MTKHTVLREGTAQPGAGLVDVQCVWLLTKKATPQWHHDERAAFEASAKAFTSNVSFERDGTEYADMTASLLWHGWKLRASQGQAPQHQARPVTPYTCPKCSALWLHWPAEQSGFGMDTLNCRSTTHCDYCEKGGVEQLQRLERVPAVLAAPQHPPAAQGIYLT